LFGLLWLKVKSEILTYVKRAPHIMTLLDATLLLLSKDKKSYFSTLVNDVLTMINPFIIKQTYEYYEGESKLKKFVITSFDNKVMLRKKWFKDGQLKSIKPFNGLYEKWYSAARWRTLT